MWMNCWKGLLQRYNAGTETMEDVLLVYAGLSQLGKGMSGSGSGPAELQVYMDTVLTLGKVSELITKDDDNKDDDNKDKE